MLRRCLPVLACLLAGAAIGAGPAAASTLTVNSTFDGLGGSCTLRQAVDAVDSPGSAAGNCAPAAFGANTIVLGSGRYQLMSPNGALSVVSTVRELTIIGAGERQTTIDASGLLDRALQIAAGATVTIRDLTISGGHAQDGASGANVGSGTAGTGASGAGGGGIFNQGSLSIIDAAVSGNVAGGGGIGGAGIPALNEPATTGGAGGAGGLGGGIFNTGTLTLSGATISNNQAGAGGAGGPGGQDSTTNPSGVGGAGGAGGAGGGVANDGGTLTITGTTINGNAAGIGGAGGPGGLAATGLGSVGGAGGNGATGADGGGIYSKGGTLSVTNSTIASNNAGAGGAGGTGGNGGTVSGGPGGAGGNAGNGGGVAAGASATLLNVTLAGNRGAAGGAGGSGGSGTTNGSSGTGGAAGQTGGVIAEGKAAVTLQNSLLSLNAGNCGPGSISDSGHNLSFGDATCPVGFLNGNPDLGALQDNGGPSKTIALQSGSAAIDQVPATGAGCPATDQRGVARPGGPKCDIGAYEVAPPVAVTGPAASIIANTEEIKATVTPNSGDADVWFQYGRTKVHGSVTAVQHLDGVTAVTVEARLRRLKPNKVYYYRVVATSSDGRATGAQRSFKASGQPVISLIRLQPTAVGPAGATITYNDSQRAMTTFAVLRCVARVGARCKRYATVRSFRHDDVAGHNLARLNVRGLPPGRYTLAAAPRAGTRRGATVTIAFSVRE